MWISKEKYNAMKDYADHNEHDANLFRSLLHNLNACDSKIIIGTDIVVMHPDILNDLYKEKNHLEDKIKELEADLEWYKVKYAEEKKKVVD